MSVTFLDQQAEAMLELSQAVRVRVEEIYSGDGRMEDLADAKDLGRALSRILVGETLREAFGSPRVERGAAMIEPRSPEAGLKALTLTQPWATLMALQKKTIETRSWWTAHRGPTVIHAAKGFPKWAQDMVIDDPRFYRALGTPCPSDLPLSCGVCVVDIVGVIRVEDMHKAEFILGRKPSVDEMTFGDFSPGRYAWLTKFIRKLPDIGPVKGSLGLWDWAESDQERAENDLFRGKAHL